jgi:cob(I)alamin adenosyltransferase
MQGEYMNQGFVQVYTGNGKGKTTAALGLSIRAAGAGKRVFIGQFLKSGQFSEISALKRYFKSIKIHQYGKKRFASQRTLKNDKKNVSKGFNEVLKVVFSEKFDIIILDEINFAVGTGLLDPMKLINLIKDKPKHTELVLTGRNAPKEIINIADLVTEMKEIKHYYKKGIKARIGIEY